MRKLILLAASIMSVNAFADNSLHIQNAQMLPPLQQQQNVIAQEPQNFDTVQSEPQTTYTKTSPFSIAAGFSGSNLKDSDGFGEKGKGFFINAAYNFDDSVNFWIELEQQKTSDEKIDTSSYGVSGVAANLHYELTEIAFGAQYKLNSDVMYAGIGTGLGFARLKENVTASAAVNGQVFKQSGSESYDYYTWRIADLELGAKINPNFSVFADIGYKLMLSLEKDTVCGYSYCVSGRAENMDLDGITYKAGLRYKF